jgi:PTS system galactitol-specific IIB component
MPGQQRNTLNWSAASMVWIRKELYENQRRVLIMGIRVIVACGSGVATSQTVASKVNRMLKEKKVDALVEAVDLKSVDRYMDGSAAYITIVKNAKEYPIPVINGIAFLTGMGKDQEFDKLLIAIEDYKKKNL